MKKIIIGFVTITMLCVIFPLASLAATTNNGDGTFTVNGKVENSETVTITVFKGIEQLSESLMFVDEIQADQTGNYHLTFSTKQVLSLDEPFYVKVASEGTVIEENVIYHPDAKPNDGDDDENPDLNPGEDDENPAPAPGDGDGNEKPGEEKPNDDTDKGETPVIGAKGDDKSDTGQDKDKDDAGKDQSGKDQNNSGQANDQTNGDDNLLPITATNIFNILLAGLILFGVGVILIYKNLRVKRSIS